MLGRTKSTMGGTGRGRSNSNATSMRSARPDAAFETIGEDEVRQPTPQVSSPPPVDDEGFSVAPADRHRNPWEDPNELVPTPAKGMSATPPGPNATIFAQTFNSSPDASQDVLSSSSSSQNNPPRLNLAMTQQPIEESEEERQIALQKMQQTLAMPAQQPSRRGTVARGRRDVRNTMFGGVSDDGLSKAPLAEMGNGSPFPMPTTNGNGQGVERPQQVARQSSMSSVTSNNPFDSPGLAAGLSPSTMATASEPGLRASITETINVIMRNAEILRVQINGEIYLSLRLPSVSQSAGPIHIRLTQFEQLEKIAPNPAFLAQVPNRPGEYFLNSEVLATATQRGSTKGTLLFKYQVHVPAGKESPAAPLILEPAFMCKEGDTRLILSYRVNPDSPLSSATLTNLSFLAAFTPGVHVSNVQAKPAGGIWSPSTRRMTWNVDEMTGTEGKIIARFTTEPGEAMVPQAVQASWAVEGVLGSGIGMEVVDGELEGGWTFEEVRKGVTTGKYLAEPIIN